MNTTFEIAIIIPVYNEQDNISIMYDKLTEVLSNYTWNIWFINDGSSDNSEEILNKLLVSNENVNVISFTRNFGHMAALTAGIDNAKGDALIMLDADMQHPPELIPEMIQKWEKGADVVQCVRNDYVKASLFKRFTSRMFYSLFRLLSGMDIMSNTADFRLLDKRVVDSLKTFNERNKFIRGLIWWTGYKRELIYFNAPERMHGETKYSRKNMFNFALNAIVSFSSFPLKLIFIVGLMILVGVIVYSLYALCVFIFTDNTQPGWLSLLLVTMFFNGIILIAMGIIGHYLATVYDEIKQRPIYIINQINGN